MKMNSSHKDDIYPPRLTFRCIFFFFFFLKLHLRLMEVPGRGGKSELQLRPTPQSM